MQTATESHQPLEMRTIYIAIAPDFNAMLASKATPPVLCPLSSVLCSLPTPDWRNQSTRSSWAAWVEVRAGYWSGSGSRHLLCSLGAQQMQNKGARVLLGVRQKQKFTLRNPNFAPYTHLYLFFYSFPLLSRSLLLFIGKSGHAKRVQATCIILRQMFGGRGRKRTFSISKTFACSLLPVASVLWLVCIVFIGRGSPFRVATVGNLHSGQQGIVKNS